MLEPQADSIGPKEKVNILLKEYDTLRAEILTRINHRWQMIGIIGAILAFGSTRGSPIRFFFAFLAVIIIFSLWVRSGQYVARLAERISHLEHRINDLAGERLLEWETQGRNRPIRRFS